MKKIYEVEVISKDGEFYERRFTANKMTAERFAKFYQPEEVKIREMHPAEYDWVDPNEIEDLTILDGWHQFGYNCKILTENSKVVIGIKDGVTVYPYRYNRKLSCWTKSSVVHYKTFLNGYLDNYILR